MSETWRLLPFAGILTVMLIWETVAPRRDRVESRLRRTWNNLLLVCLNSLMLRLLPVLSAVGAATLAEQRSWGLFNNVAIASWLELILVLVLFDLLIYWQHVAAHRIPMLWDFHKVHHADHDLDATSGLRFHPFEIAFSMLVKCIGVIALGASPLAVFIFEIVLNGCAIFNHSNVNLPQPIDRILRLAVVTPDMHRVHHSVNSEEANSNFGFNIPWWDRVFGTYRAQPEVDHRELDLGIPELPNEEQTVPLSAMLRMPFRATTGRKR